MIKTIKIFKDMAPAEDYGWAVAMSDSERIAYATRLTHDLWCMAHGGSFPKMDRTMIHFER